ncbi:MAG: HAD-IC family P-type ATPase, partial [Lactobacillus sp.]|nr:HAD-IC family P-type ATPase [Lactobacillus sp.]
MPQKFYNQEIENVAQELSTSTSQGLQTSQISALRAKYGTNSLASKKKTSIWQRFLAQFKDFMIIVLIVAALLSGFVAQEWTDAAIIMIVVILNAVLGVFQETRSEEAINALKKMATPNAHVRRDGQIVEIPSPELLPGDVVLLEAGDVVPADLRLTVTKSLKIEESALTGESVPVDKNVAPINDEKVALADQDNMAFANTN